MMEIGGVGRGIVAQNQKKNRPSFQRTLSVSIRSNIFCQAEIEDDALKQVFNALHRNIKHSQARFLHTHRTLAEHVIITSPILQIVSAEGRGQSPLKTAQLGVF